jgi:hypothetical protein
LDWGLIVLFLFCSLAAKKQTVAVRRFMVAGRILALCHVTNKQQTPYEIAMKMASSSSILQLLLVLLVILVDKVKSQGAITSFRLVNASTGADIGLLSNNQVLFLNTLPPTGWTIIAISGGSGWIGRIQP